MTIGNVTFSAGGAINYAQMLHGVPAQTPQPQQADPAYVQEVERLKKKQLDRLMETPELEVPWTAERPFKNKIDDIADAVRRYESCVFFVAGKPLYVAQVFQKDDDFQMIVYGADQKKRRVSCSHPYVSFRCPAARYIQLDSNPFFLSRMPVRQQQQGLCHTNAKLKAPGTSEWGGLRRMSDYLGALENTEIMPWDERLEDFVRKKRLLRSVRLSNDVAVYREDSQGHSLAVEYKGRELGELTEDTVLIPKAEPEWVRKSVTAVSLKLKEA